MERLLGVEHRFAQPRHPRTCGKVENLNRQIKWDLNRQVTEKGGEWCDHVGAVIWGQNNKAHSVIKEIPFEVMFRRKDTIRKFPTLTATEFGVEAEQRLSRTPESDATSQILIQTKESEAIGSGDESSGSCKRLNEGDEDVQWFSKISQNIAAGKRKQDAAYQKLQKNKRSIFPGMLVRHKNIKKFRGKLEGKSVTKPKFIGPFKVVKLLNRGHKAVIESLLDKSTETVNVKDLRAENLPLRWNFSKKQEMRPKKLRCRRVQRQKRSNAMK
ncbi:uncharacterized protein LOC129601840 [Paramacrobiotus metropolitanus]|uniref:uncharacterized protein LOC129601840 n=1 Tax=Paramacrobiotus metropolitanus TaxID=2943436 RepID=UPI0024456B95|nr:uncharacterized protein LOC129601840 [Paramacrobiotus metropolitanus]